jgi:hypothetical protein
MNCRSAFVALVASTALFSCARSDAIAQSNPQPLAEPRSGSAKSRAPAPGGNASGPKKAETTAGIVTAHPDGLHGYIGFGHEKLPSGSAYTAGMGFYAAVWPLVEEPLAHFQIGLPSAWITPDNSDNKDKPLAPVGTRARQWPERGPTWDSVFQTVEGGLGYWAGNHFRYGPPKFSLNATPGRDGGPSCSGRFDAPGAWKPKLMTHTTRYDQAGKKLSGVERVFDTKVFDGNVWGLQWLRSDISPQGLFPQYSKHQGNDVVAVAENEVPAETMLRSQEFELAGPGKPYTSPNRGAWSKPGPKTGPKKANLADGSVVTYSWYRFVDQPSFQQYEWSEAKKATLQALVAKLHATWPIDRDYMAPPTHGRLVSLDPALIVTPPPGLEVGYVPIVTHQERQ